VPFVDCPQEPASWLYGFPVEEGRRVSAVHWLPAAGGLLLTSSGVSRFEEQRLFFVSSTTSPPQPLRLPVTLRSPVDGVHLLAVPELRVLLGEAWIRGAELELSLLGQLRGVPYHGDLLLADLEGVELYRHRSAHDALVSPDSRWLAYWRSNLNGLHNLFVARPGGEEVAFVAAVVEADPGSGKSFDACWSDDSRYLHVEGLAEGFQRFSWSYDTRRRALYEEGG
jgi:hypothetical protein